MADANLDLLIRIRADLEKAVKDIKRLTGEIGQQNKNTRAAATGAKGYDRALRNLTVAASGYVTVASAIRAIKLADQFQVLEQRIKTATKATGDYVQVSRELFAISQRNGTQLEGSVAVFQGLARSAAELGASNKDILKVTEAVQQLGIISGASNTALSAGLLQFSQGLAAGVFRAEEMNSIMENLPEVAVRIANGMGMTVGQLRQAVLAGELLSKDVFDSLLKQTDQINQEMADIPISLERAMQKLDNSTSRMLSSIEKRFDIIKSLSQFVGSLSDIIDDTQGSAEFFAAIGLFGEQAFIDQIVIEQQRKAVQEWQNLHAAMAPIRDEILKIENEIKGLNSLIQNLPDDSPLLEKYTQRLDGLKQRHDELNTKIKQGSRENDKLGEAGRKAAQVATEEQARLAAALDQVKTKLQQQLQLFDKQRAAVAQAEANAARFQLTLKDAQTQLEGVSKTPQAPGILDIAKSLSKAGQLLKDGDFKGSQQAAENTLKIIQAVAEAGGAADITLQDYLRSAGDIGTQAAQGLVDSEKAAFEKVKATIADLLAEAEKLKALKIGIDAESAQQEAELTRASIQEEFNNNPLVLPIILRKPDTSGLDQVDDALDNLPGKARGGLLRGPGSGTSDSILMWGSNGEYVSRAAAVRYYGKDFFDRINSLRLPRYADGGLITTPSPLAGFTPAAAPGGQPVNLYLNGQQFPVTASPDTVKEMQRAFGRESLKRGIRRG